VDGVALFQRITELSGEIKLRYKDRKITLIFPKHKKWLNQVTRAMEIVDAARRKEPA
jgi:transcription-repair coupling factor (superfamily II helicase)